jgi:hypothetical protein
MHYYRVHLPKNNHWNDEYESWIEKSFTSGKVDTLEIDLDDIHGIIPTGSTLDEIPLILDGSDEITIID